MIKYLIPLQLRAKNEEEESWTIFIKQPFKKLAAVDYQEFKVSVTMKNWY